jgi:Icc-related predicted phosphoesterase
MARFLGINDVHLSEKAPASCTDTYLPDLLELMAQAARKAREQVCSAVVVPGDLFHHKAPSRTSHRLIQLVLSLVADSRIPWVVVPGNHDMSNDRLETIGTVQPLGVLARAGIRILDGWAKPEVFPLFGVPWQQEWSDEVVTAKLEPYRLRHTWSPVQGKAGNTLLVTHAPLYPPGQELEFENYPAAKWAEAMGGKGFCLYGHVHEAHGIWECGGVTFCNPGALSRGSIHEHNLTRTPSASVWDSDTGTFSILPLVARPASEVFRLTEREEATDMAGRLDEFLAGISGTTLQAVTVSTVMEHVAQLGLQPRAVALIEELLEEASA